MKRADQSGAQKRQKSEESKIEATRNTQSLTKYFTNQPGTSRSAETTSASSSEQDNETPQAHDSLPKQTRSTVDDARTCQGNIAHLHPSGQHSGGVAASHRDAAYDKRDLEKHRSCYEAVANKHGVPAAVIGGIASRESRGGRLLTKTGGYGDNGNGWGIMQCDTNTSGLPCKTHNWDSCDHIDMMVGKTLVPSINQVARKHPTWSKEQQLQGGVAAYNFGVSNVQTWKGLDNGTTHNDYSNDVIARAQYLQSKGWSK